MIKEKPPTCYFFSKDISLKARPKPSLEPLDSSLFPLLGGDNTNFSF